jgi:hypothetical protein
MRVLRGVGVSWSQSNKYKQLKYFYQKYNIFL